MLEPPLSCLFSWKFSETLALCLKYCFVGSLIDENIRDKPSSLGNRSFLVKRAYQAHSLYAYRTYSYSYSTVIFEPFIQNTVTVTQFQLYSDTQLFTVTIIYVRQWCTVILGQSLFLQKIRWNSCFLPKCTHCMDGIDSMDGTLLRPCSRRATNQSLIFITRAIK